MKVLETDTLTVSANGTLPRVPFLALKDKILGTRYQLSVSFVSPKKAQSFNKTYRDKEYVPNTLSFPLTKTSGEIILCTQAMKKEFKDFEMEYEEYLLFIIIHSMLHLKGYDHGSTMERKEKELLRFFSSHTNEATHKRRH